MLFSKEFHHSPGRRSTSSGTASPDLDCSVLGSGTSASTPTDDSFIKQERNMSPEQEGEEEAARRLEDDLQFRDVETKHGDMKNRSSPSRHSEDHPQQQAQQHQHRVAGGAAGPAAPQAAPAGHYTSFSIADILRTPYIERGGNHHSLGDLDSNDSISSESDEDATDLMSRHSRSLNDVAKSPTFQMMDAQPRPTSETSADVNTRFSWLQCTRYRPPKLPRIKKKDGVRKRKLGRNPRVPFTQHQVAVLEHKFRQTHYLSSVDVAELSAALNLTETRVKIWFQNRRARERRDRDDTGSDPSQGHMMHQGQGPMTSKGHDLKCTTPPLNMTSPALAASTRTTPPSAPASGANTTSHVNYNLTKESRGVGGMGGVPNGHNPLAMLSPAGLGGCHPGAAAAAAAVAAAAAGNSAGTTPPGGGGGGSGGLDPLLGGLVRQWWPLAIPAAHLNPAAHAQLSRVFQRASNTSAFSPVPHTARPY